MNYPIDTEILREAEAEGAPAGHPMAASQEARPSRKKVFLVEDHVLFRTQLANLISRDSRLFVCGEADNATEALEKIKETNPDLLIIDITLKGTNGLELIKELRTRASDAPILVLSMHDESMYAERALRAGASGYISKSQTSAQLKDAIHHVLQGDVYLSAHMTSKLLMKMTSEEEPAPEAKGVATLSPREREIFQYIGKGFTTRDIAHELQLGEKTVHSHRFQIKAKLGIRHNAELYTLAARWVEDQKNPAQVGIAPGQKLQQDEGMHE